MTFRIPRINVVESDEGFSVEVVSPTEIWYSENGTVWLVSSEFSSSDAIPVIIYGDSIRPIGDQLTERSLSIGREEIIDNIKQAFRFRGVDVQVM